MSAKRIGSAIAVLAFAGSVGYLVAQSQVNDAAKESVRAMADKIEMQAGNGLRIDFDKVDAPILGDKITVSDIELKNVDGRAIFGIDSLGMKADGYVKNEKFPTSAKYELKGIKIVDEKIKAKVNDDSPINYGDSEVDVTFGYDFDAEADTLSAYSYVDAPEMNKMSGDITISNIADIWSAVEANYAENDGKVDFEYREGRDVERKFRYVELNDLALTYENKGEIEKLLDRASEEQGVSVEEMKAEAPNVIDYYLGDAEFAGELKKFVADPGKLSLTLKPENPIRPQELVERFMRAGMGDTETALDGLGLEVKAN